MHKINTNKILLYPRPQYLPYVVKSVQHSTPGEICFLPQASSGGNPMTSIRHSPVSVTVSFPSRNLHPSPEVLPFSFFFSLLAGCAPTSHAPINQLNHAPEDAGWWSCPGQCERFHSRRGLIISAAAAQDKGAFAIRQQRLSRLAGVRIAVLLV